MSRSHQAALVAATAIGQWRGGVEHEENEGHACSRKRQNGRPRITASAQSGHSEDKRCDSYERGHCEEERRIALVRRPADDQERGTDESEGCCGRRWCSLARHLVAFSHWLFARLSH